MTDAIQGVMWAATLLAVAELVAWLPGGRHASAAAVQPTADAAQNRTPYRIETSRPRHSIPQLSSR